MGGRREEEARHVRVFCVINEPIQVEKIAPGGSLGSGGAFLHVRSSSCRLQIRESDGAFSGLLSDNSRNQSDTSAVLRNNIKSAN